MIVHQHHEPGVGERLGKPLQPVLLHAREAVCHRDRRMRPCAIGDEQPAPQSRIAFDRELDVMSLHHFGLPSCVVDPYNIDDARSASE